jgi:SPP1 gp7 family putative phage head morphogenesis protein
MPIALVRRQSGDDAAILAEILAIADSLEPEARDALLKAVRESKHDRSELERALTIATIAAVLATLPLADIEAGFAWRIRLALRRATLTASELAAGHFAAAFGETVPLETVQYVAATWADQHAASLVTGVMDETRSALETIIGDALRGGLSLDEAVASIERVIGLTERQALAVERFYRERLLEGLSRPNARRLAEEYAAKLLHHRATMIGRTEMVRAVNQGQLTVWREARRLGMLSSDYVREWVAIMDTKVCETCSALHGTRAEINGSYAHGYSPGGAHSQCRCSERLTKRTAASGPAMIEDSTGVLVPVA